MSVKHPYLLLFGVLLTSSFCFSADGTNSDNIDIATHCKASFCAALEAEAEGDFLGRQRMLVEAQQNGFAPALWHGGQIQQSDGNWKSVESSMEEFAQDDKLTQYQQRRSQLEDTVANHLLIARWCASQKLGEQCQAHLSRVIDMQPENLLAREALGYTRVGNEWISPKELEKLAADAQFAKESEDLFGAQIRQLAGAYGSDNWQKALEMLSEIEDPKAVPTVESVFANPNPELASAGIDWLNKVDSVSASQALARFALFHPVNSVRSQAAEKLADRPLHDFVPDLLKMLSGPVSMMVVPVWAEDGTLQGYRQAFTQEKFDQQNTMVLDRGFRSDPIRVRIRPTARPARRIDANDIPLEATREEVLAVNRMIELSTRQQASGEVANAGVSMQRENMLQQQRNTAIANVLSIVARREFDAQPKEMWNWWDEVNESGFQEYKPERYLVNRRISPVRRYREIAKECFVAGTPVVTHRGRLPIEQIAVGDLVLSRSPITGVLSWKPVLRTTTRPPETTLRISIGDENVACTTGHLFWVSGKGWQKASELKPGDILHGAKEPALVYATEKGASEPTFNLVVSDNATYFVGKAMLMSHDVTPRGSYDRQPVPGQHFVGLFSSDNDQP